MRIISALVALPILTVMIFPQGVLAAETAMTNETNINFKIKENTYFIDGLVITDSNMTKITPRIYPGYVPVKTPEDIKREKVLAKYGERRKNTVYPEGKFVINASAYTAAADECGKSDGITASGLKVKEKHTLACPPQFPFGTKIKIEGMGTYACEDRGGAIKGNHIDIYMQTKAEAFAFGRRNLMAEVVM